MKAALTTLGALVWAWTLCQAATQPAPSQDTRASAVSLSGAVITKDDRPIRRATVELVGSQLTRSVETDDEGRFSFADVVPGVYRLFASKPSWLRTEYGAVMLGGVGQPIEVGDAIRLRPQLVLTRGAVLAGTIRDMNGAPMPDVLVSASLGSVSHTVWTNNLGEYRVYGLPPGEYLIGAVPQRGVAKLLVPAMVMTAAQVDATLARLRTRQASGTVATGSSTSQATRASATPTASSISGVGPVFYPGTPSDELATRIELAEGEEVGGLDFSLSAFGSSSIRGTINPLDRKTVARVFVSARRAGQVATSVRPTVTAAGTFEMSNLTPGRYIIEARQTLVSAPGGGVGTANGATALPYASWGHIEVDVPPGAALNVAVDMQPPLTFSGRVVVDAVDAGARPLGTGVSLSLFRLDSAPSELPVARAAARSDGQFVLTGFAPGPYRLVASVAASRTPWRLTSVMADGRERLDPVLEFTAEGGKTQNAIVTLSAHHTELSGTLTTGNGIAAALYRILAFSTDQTMWRPGSRRVALATPGLTGRFVFDDLPPGDYFLAALAAPNAAWQTPEFLTQAVPSAVTLTLAEGRPTVQDLAIGVQSPNR